MASFTKEVKKGKRNREDPDNDTDVKKTKIINEYTVDTNDKAYDLLRENDEIKIDDIIHVIPNNQEGYEKYIVVEHCACNKDLRMIDNYYKIQQRAHEEDNQQGGKKNKSNKQRKSKKGGKTRKNRK